MSIHMSAHVSSIHMSIHVSVQMPAISIARCMFKNTYARPQTLELHVLRNHTCCTITHMYGTDLGAARAAQSYMLHNNTYVRHRPWSCWCCVIESPPPRVSHTPGGSFACLTTCRHTRPNTCPYICPNTCRQHTSKHMCLHMPTHMSKNANAHV